MDKIVDTIKYDLLMYLTPYEIYCLRCVFDEHYKELSYTKLFRIGYIKSVEECYKCYGGSLMHFHYNHYCKDKGLICCNCLTKHKKEKISDKDEMLKLDNFDICYDCKVKGVGNSFISIYIALDNDAKYTTKREETRIILRKKCVINELFNNKRNMISGNAQYTKEYYLMTYGSKYFFNHKRLEQLNKLFLN